jgi:acetyl-CoA synthetase
MRFGEVPVKKTSRASLKLLGSVGEPINPEAWLWYYHVVGDARCPIVDTWWQTETGGHMMTPLPGAHALKPGSCAMPFFGVQPELYDSKILTNAFGDSCIGSLPSPPVNGGDSSQIANAVQESPHAMKSEVGKESPPFTGGQGGNVDDFKIVGEGQGMLVIADSWPGQARTVYGNHTRFIETYFSQVPGKYFTADGARRDDDGYYWITGRVDDVIKVSGHRLGTAEIESALVGHADVAEAAVVGYPHAIKGEGIYAYVTLNAGAEGSPARADELKQWVRKTMGPVAQPDFIHFTPGLPKTRSGKIMRRILRKIAANDTENLGDTSTLLDPEIVKALIETRMNKA